MPRKFPRPRKPRYRWVTYKTFLTEKAAKKLVARLKARGAGAKVVPVYYPPRKTYVYEVHTQSR